MKRRVTYIVSEEATADPISHLKAVSKSAVDVHELPASKHVRIRLRGGAADIGLVSVEWARRRLLELPFDPPAELGTHVDAGLDAGLDAVRDWAARLGVALGEPIETDDWFAWFNSSAPAPARAQPELADLRGADAVRIFTNPAADELVAEAWFAPAVWTESIAEPAEVGVFSAKRADGDITLQGRVRRLGTDDFSEPMLLHWYPRHRLARGHAAARFVEPYGLHPTLEVAIGADKPLPVCRLFVKLDLPPQVFIDQYQLDDLPRYEPPSELIDVWGETDLELPVWAVNKGSIGLLMLSEPGTHQIPLHFRYVSPNASLELQGSVPEPAVFWACHDERMPRRRNLEDRESIGIASAFPLEDTAFYVVESNGIDFRVPAIAPEHTHAVEVSTFIVVLLGFLAVLAAIVRSVRQQPKLKND